MIWNDMTALRYVANGFKGEFAMVGKIPFTRLELALFRKAENDCEVCGKHPGEHMTLDDVWQCDQCTQDCINGL